MMWAIAVYMFAICLRVFPLRLFTTTWDLVHNPLQMMQKTSFSVRGYNTCLISSTNADLEGEVSPLERTPSQKTYLNFSCGFKATIDKVAGGFKDCFFVGEYFYPACNDESTLMNAHLIFFLLKWVFIFEAHLQKRRRRGFSPNYETRVPTRLGFPQPPKT